MPDPTPSTGSKSARRKKIIMIAAGGVLLLLVVVLSRRRSSKSEPEIEAPREVVSQATPAGGGEGAIAGGAGTPAASGELDSIRAEIATTLAGLETQSQAAAASAEQAGAAAAATAAAAADAAGATAEEKKAAEEAAYARGVAKVHANEKAKKAKAPKPHKGTVKGRPKAGHKPTAKHPTSKKTPARRPSHHTAPHKSSPAHKTAPHKAPATHHAASHKTATVHHAAPKKALPKPKRRR